MFFDLKRESTTPAELTADVAIVGAGAAGLTVCRRLLAQGLQVILLESGGLDYERSTSDLNVGHITGEPYYDLDDARLRFFGGSTAIWGGRCAELDPIDFERRDWVPHSGWPIRYEAVRPYYAEAWRALDLPPDPHRFLPPSMPPFRDNELEAHAWLFDNQADRFSFRRNRDLARTPGCTIVTHATVREIVAGANGDAIERLDVTSLSGRSLTVRAKTYVLAAGGIENPRLLLASRSVMPEGLGNRYDQVGRYFMEHPHGRGGKVVGGATWRLLKAFQKHRRENFDVAAVITPSAKLQQEAGLLNTALSIVPRRPAHAREALLMRAYLRARHKGHPTTGGRALWRTVKKTVGTLQRVSDPLRPWIMHKLGRMDVALLLRAEQAPDPESRITLAKDRDATGMPRVKLDWRIGELDVRSASGLVAALGRELKRLDLGTVEPTAWLAGTEWVTDQLVSTHPIGGYHHIGTTRMSDDPRTGVTDSEGRVHGLANLYVVGSSNFPTSGWANPTLTIIALAARTADLIAAAKDRDRVIASAPSARAAR